MKRLPPPSPRVRELSDRLEAELRRYRGDHPAVSDRDVRLAIRLLATRVGTRTRARAVGAFVGGLAAVVGVAAALVLSGSREAVTVWETLGASGLTAIVAAVLAIVILLVRWRR